VAAPAAPVPDVVRRPAGPGRRDAADTTAAKASRGAAGTAVLDAAACLAAGAADVVHPRDPAAVARDMAVADQVRRRDAEHPAGEDARPARLAVLHQRAWPPSARPASAGRSVVERPAAAPMSAAAELAPSDGSLRCGVAMLAAQRGREPAASGPAPAVGPE